MYRKADEKEGEGVGGAPPSRYDDGILLDYDPSGTISRNLLEYFHNILLTNRIATDPRTFLPEPSSQNLLDVTVYNSLLMVWTLLF